MPCLCRCDVCPCVRSGGKTGWRTSFERETPDRRRRRLERGRQCRVFHNRSLTFSPRAIAVGCLPAQPPERGECDPRERGAKGGAAVGASPVAPPAPPAPPCASTPRASPRRSPPGTPPRWRRRAPRPPSRPRRTRGARRRAARRAARAAPPPPRAQQPSGPPRRQRAPARDARLWERPGGGGERGVPAVRRRRDGQRRALARARPHTRPHQHRVRL